MEINDFNELPLNARKEIIRQGTTNILWFKLAVFAIILIAGSAVSHAFIKPYYNVWAAKMEAKAEIAKRSLIEECQ